MNQSQARNALAASLRARAPAMRAVKQGWLGETDEPVTTDEVRRINARRQPRNAKGQFRRSLRSVRLPPVAYVAIGAVSALAVVWIALELAPGVVGVIG